MYGNYRLWAEGPNGAGFTGYQYLGDPYAGVSLVGGMLEFTDQTSYDNLQTRLTQAYEDHQSKFFDPWNNLTDDQMNDYAEAQGFDEFLPFKEFEAYWGFSSLRNLIQNDVANWMAVSHTDMTGYPEDNYFIADEPQQTILNTSGQVKVAGAALQLPVLMPAPPNPGELSCIYEDRKRGEDNYESNRILKKRIIIDGEDCVQSATCPLPPDISFKGKALTFKKSGLFKKFATKMRVRLYGKAYNNICNFLKDYDTAFNNPDLRRRYRMVVENPFLNTNFIGTKYYETTEEIQLIGNTYSLVYAP